MSWPASVGSATMAEEAYIASISPNAIRRGQRDILVTALRGGERQRHLYQRRRDTDTGNPPMRHRCRHKTDPCRCLGVHRGTRQFTQLAETLAAPVTTGANRVPLPLIIAATCRAAPGVFRWRVDGLLQGMAGGDAETVAVHDRHHALKLGAMIRPPLQNIVFPLMNHLMRQRPHNFLFRLIF